MLLCNELTELLVYRFPLNIDLPFRAIASIWALWHRMFFCSPKCTKNAHQSIQSFVDDPHIYINYNSGYILACIDCPEKSEIDLRCLLYKYLIPPKCIKSKKITVANSISLSNKNCKRYWHFSLHFNNHVVLETIFLLRIAMWCI